MFDKSVDPLPHRLLSLQVQFIFGSGTAESPISHLVRTLAPSPCVQQILNYVIG